MQHLPDFTPLAPCIHLKTEQEVAQVDGYAGTKNEATEMF